MGHSYVYSEVLTLYGVLGQIMSVWERINTLLIGFLFLILYVFTYAL